MKIATPIGLNATKKNLDDHDISDELVKFKQIVLGVKYLHDKDIAHLSAANILQGKDLQWKIADFGISSHFGRLTNGRDYAAQHRTKKSLSHNRISECDRGETLKQFDMRQLAWVLVDLLARSSGYNEEKFYKEFEADYLPIAKIAKSLLSKEDPASRPSATELLSSKLFSNNLRTGT